MQPFEPKRFVLPIVAGLVAGGVASVLTLVVHFPDSTAISAGSSRGLDTAELLARMESIGSRLAELESGMDRGSRPVELRAGTQRDGAERPALDPDRTAVDRPATDPALAAPDLERRIVAIEATLRDLGERIGGLGPLPDDLAGVLLALDDRNLAGHDVDAAERERRMALNRWLLDNAPNHARSAAALDALTTDLHRTAGAERALAAWEQFAPRVGVDGWAFDRRRAGLLTQVDRHDEARRIYLDGENSVELDDSDRASAMFWRAYSYQEQARYDEAKAVYLQLIARYGTGAVAGVDDSVAGARTQIEKIESWGH